MKIFPGCPLGSSGTARLLPTLKRPHNSAIHRMFYPFFLINILKLILFLVSSPEVTFLFIAFRERGRERERKKHQLVVFLHIPWPQIEPSTWVCAMTGNPTCDLWVYGTMFQSTEPYQPGLKAYSSTWEPQHCKSLRSLSFNWQNKQRVGFLF